MEFSFPPFPPTSHKKLSNLFHKWYWDLDPLHQLWLIVFFWSLMEYTIFALITIKWSCQKYWLNNTQKNDIEIPFFPFWYHIWMQCTGFAVKSKKGTMFHQKESPFQVKQKSNSWRQISGFKQVQFTALTPCLIFSL